MGMCAYVCTGPTKLTLEAFVEHLAPYMAAGIQAPVFTSAQLVFLTAASLLQTPVEGFLTGPLLWAMFVTIDIHPFGSWYCPHHDTAQSQRNGGGGGDLSKVTFNCWPGIGTPVLGQRLSALLPFLSDTLWGLITFAQGL